jgi:hypothetical protein
MTAGRRMSVHDKPEVAGETIGRRLWRARWPELAIILCALIVAIAIGVLGPDRRGGQASGNTDHHGRAPAANTPQTP